MRNKNDSDKCLDFLESFCPCVRDFPRKSVKSMDMKKEDFHKCLKLLENNETHGMTTKRILSLLLYSFGYTVESTSKALDISKRTVSRLQTLYKKEGLDSILRKNSGYSGVSVISESECDEVARYLKKHKPSKFGFKTKYWLVSEALSVIQKNVNPRITYSILYKIFKTCLGDDVRFIYGVPFYVKDSEYRNMLMKAKGNSKICDLAENLMVFIDNYTENDSYFLRHCGFSKNALDNMMQHIVRVVREGKGYQGCVSYLKNIRSAENQKMEDVHIYKELVDFRPKVHKSWKSVYIGLLKILNQEETALSVFKSTDTYLMAIYKYLRQVRKHDFSFLSEERKPIGKSRKPPKLNKDQGELLVYKLNEISKWSDDEKYFGFSIRNFVENTFGISCSDKYFRGFWRAHGFRFCYLKVAETENSLEPRYKKLLPDVQEFILEYQRNNPAFLCNEFNLALLACLQSKYQESRSSISHKISMILHSMGYRKRLCQVVH